MFSQHSGHSACGRPCRPCSCSHTKYAAPATSTKLRPPPKGRPGALGMRGGIAVHLSIDTVARSGVIAGSPAPSSVTPSGRIDCKPWRRCPCRPMWPASLTAPGFGDLAPRCRSALVTLCCRSWSLIARGIRCSAQTLARLSSRSRARRSGSSARSCGRLSCLLLAGRVAGLCGVASTSPDIYWSRWSLHVSAGYPLRRATDAVGEAGTAGR